MNSPHAMLAESNHDELAEQKFVVALKWHIASQLMPKVRAVVENEVVPQLKEEGSEHPPFRDIRRKLEDRSEYLNWMSVTRAAQELMWQAAGDCVDRQIEELEERAEGVEPLGSLRVNPDFEVPPYLAAMDTHLMPGSYYFDTKDDDIRQGALFDKGASLYSLGRQGWAAQRYAGPHGHKPFIRMLSGYRAPAFVGDGMYGGQ